MSELIYIILPLLFLVHKTEDAVGRKIARKMPVGRFCAVGAAELLLVLAATALFIYGILPPLLVVFYGFTILLVTKLVQVVQQRRYVPGAYSAFLFLSYAALGTFNLVERYSLCYNVMLALGGFALAAADFALAQTVAKGKQ